VTFLACLLWNLAYGILVGVGVQLVFILYSIARPKVQIEEKKVIKIGCVKAW
jgi:solute carrier family 26 (sodium-independent sulfate anion transporter), member 11